MFTLTERKSPSPVPRMKSRFLAVVIAGLWAGALAVAAMTVLAWLSSPAHAAPAATQKPGQSAAPTPIKAPAGIGRDATAAELNAWDIDVRPDFKGLPKGHGSVADGRHT